MPALFASLFVLLLASLSFAQNYFEQANTLYDEGKYAEAVPVYRSAIRARQLEPYAWFNMGNALVHLGRNDLALVAYNRSKELAPHFPRPWVLLGDLYYTYGDLGLALASYGRARELGEDSEHLDYATAAAGLRLKDYTMAERYFEAVLNRNPDRIDAWFGLAEAYSQIGDYQMAAGTLKKAIDLSPAAGADVYFTLAYYYTQMDSAGAATLAMENALMLSPQNAGARRYLAQMYVRQGSPWMAIWTLEQGIAAGGSNREVRELCVDLGQIFFGQKRYDEALAAFTKAWKLGSPQGRIGMDNVHSSL
jgi:tetratricopeptide (TPR) repeat protein